MSVFDKEDKITIEYLIDLGFYKYTLYTEEGENILLVLNIRPKFKRSNIGGIIAFNTKISAYGNIFEIRREIEPNCFEIEEVSLNDNSDVDILIKRESDLLWNLLEEKYEGVGCPLDYIIDLDFE